LDFSRATPNSVPTARPERTGKGGTGRGLEERAGVEDPEVSLEEEEDAGVAVVFMV